MSVTEALKVMRDPEAVAELAERAAAFVPDGSARDGKIDFIVYGICAGQFPS